MTFTQTERDKFWSCVDRSGECWIWLRGKDSDGYGITQLQRRQWRAHRAAYALTYEDPGSLFVLHHCDNPSCVRPDHLWLGTNDDNMSDMVAKGRSKRGTSNASHIAGGAYQRGEKNGRAKITEVQVLEIRSRAIPYRRGIYAELGREYGLTAVAIRNIVNGKLWSHVGKPKTSRGRRGEILEAIV